MITKVSGQAIDMKRVHLGDQHRRDYALIGISCQMPRVSMTSR